MAEELPHVICGPGGERIWTDDVGSKGAVRVSFHVVPYHGEYPGDPLDGKPTTAMYVSVDETKKPNYAVRIPTYNGGPISPKAMAYVMRDSVPHTGLQPDEFDLVCRVLAVDVGKALAEFGHREGLKDIFARLPLPDRKLLKLVEKARAEQNNSGCQAS
ncbi:MAG: hypothetical protein AABX75_02785 [Nanoarchaeota archaeon]